MCVSLSLCFSNLIGGNLKLPTVFVEKSGNSFYYSYDFIQ